MELRPTPDTLLDVLEWQPLEATFEMKPSLNSSLLMGNMCGGMRLSERAVGGAQMQQGAKEITDSTVFAFRIEYLLHGKTMARGRGVWSSSPMDRGFARYDAPIEITDQDWDRRISEELQVRFTTDREDVPRDWNATHYWSGDITLPARPLFGLPERVSDSAAH